MDRLHFGDESLLLLLGDFVILVFKNKAHLIAF